MFNGIHHVAIICDDYPRSKHFYTEVLGFTILAENYREDRHSYKLDLQLADGSQIELFSIPNSPKRPSYPEAQGLRHLAFKVTDIDAVVAHLTSHHVDVEPIRIDEYTGKKFTFFSDPDALPLEIYQTQ
ncbi:VOC family protein [Shewanella sp. 3_MG-2023]|uniref:SMU1112c/YaeR family gloxylase I-like metalloprotein n=1 Tax=Shewanella sp. 3_MG-2023 TaxID=3062635 RepID=UPI0026E39A82|nr:VOC family protein [Shewanella sp. 3_MG-2023]MDO6777256.1 VOC family protein [Shewanella sp. 3_MG-2023]